MEPINRPNSNGNNVQSESSLFTTTDYMFVAKCVKGGDFSEGKIVPYGNIEVSPGSAILNYGQGMFEGLKAYRTEDNRILLFRPDQNALRMKMGSERMCMPAPSAEFFVDAVKKTVLANKKWVPRSGEGTMYIRPLLMGTGPTFSLTPAPEYTFLIYTLPVLTRQKEESGISLIVDDKNHRSHRGGTGCVKSCTNYSPILKPLHEAKASGFTNVVYLDAATRKNVEETPLSNVFCVKGNVVSTPALNGTVLPGVTRKSMIELARDLGYQVEERDLPLEELLDADEVFCTGTAVVVTPVETLSYNDKKFTYRTGEESLASKLHELLTGIQIGRAEDRKGWTVELEQSD